MMMPPSTPSPLAELLKKLETGRLKPAQVAQNSIARANANASRNTYLYFDTDELTVQGATLPMRFSSAKQRPALYGVPVSVKDCFDVTGSVTTAGTHFYAAHNAPARSHSAVAQRLLDLGCMITGKTHLHPLAYGITGENPDFSPCLQPRDRNLLTGGSSSGAAASVQEESALFAIGTDTGGSIRVPAALCGLAGFRASHSMTEHWPEMWQGAMHLAPSFDTLGLLTRQTEDLEPLALAFFQMPAAPPHRSARIGTVPISFLQDATPDVFSSFAAFQDILVESGADLVTFNVDWWQDAFEILAPIQAHEAAQIHAGNFDHFEPLIAQRLHWGASIAPEELAGYRARHDAFRARLNALFEQFDFLIVPAAPHNRLPAYADHTRTRAEILRYTAPFSLGGNPVVSLRGERIGEAAGTGFQLAAAPGKDAELLAFTTFLTNNVLPRR